METRWRRGLSCLKRTLEENLNCVREQTVMACTGTEGLVELKDLKASRSLLTGLLRRCNLNQHRGFSPSFKLKCMHFCFKPIKGFRSFLIKKIPTMWIVVHIYRSRSLWFLIKTDWNSTHRSRTVFIQLDNWLKMTSFSDIPFKRNYEFNLTITLHSKFN